MPQFWSLTLLAALVEQNVPAMSVGVKETSRLMQRVIISVAHRLQMAVENGDALLACLSLTHSSFEQINRHWQAWSRSSGHGMLDKAEISKEACLALKEGKAFSE